MRGAFRSFALGVLISSIISIANLPAIHASQIPAEVDFLELGATTGADQLVKSKCPDDTPSWECDSPPVAPQKASMPALPASGPKVPVAFKCSLYCIYGGGFNFNSTLPKNVGAQALYQEDAGVVPPNPRDVSTLFVDTSRKNHYPSFVEVGPVGPADEPAADASGKKTSLSNPFTCKTQCQFPRQPMCNPVYNFRLGPAGMRPDEKECCAQCDQLCSKKQVLWQFRVCVHGCRAFCPFKFQHWSTWES